MRRAAALLLVCACHACGDDCVTTVLPGLVTVSSCAPWDSSTCRGPAGSGVLHQNAEVEPYVAIDPIDPNHLIGIWQQDRWSNGGSTGLVAAATFDGGRTWTRSFARFSRCSGGSFQRATDPWVSISPNGMAYQIGYVFDWDAPNRAMLVSQSTDGGRSWGPPIALQQDSDPDLIMDKETLTADPIDASYAYAVWNRLTGVTIRNNPNGTGPAWFARTTNGGVSWETARLIYDPGPDTQTVSNQIVVLPDGTLINVLLVLTQNSSTNPTATVAVLRSINRGVDWSSPHIAVAEAQFVGVVDPKNGRGIRGGSVVPSIAVDRASSALYIAWEDARFSNMARDGIAVSKSTDGGSTWSAPVQVNAAPGAQAFTPTLAVAEGGKLGVTYYDLRNDDPADNARLLTTHWLAVSTDGGATFTETMIGPPFDLRAAPLVEGPAYFLGDYQALVAAGPNFLPFFVAVPASGPSDVFFRPADAAPAASNSNTLTVAPRGEQMWRAARERWRFGTLFK
jgi:hypothetical protein